MNENEILTEMGKELVKQSYKDISEHIVKPTAKLVGLLPETINRLLLPVYQWVEEGKYNLEETKKLLAIKLENVAKEDLIQPETYIAVPALQYISYCMDNEELRDMYANLLASSMNKVVKNDVHPSYVEIIKQLCPDEAKILRTLNREGLFPLLHVKYVKGKTQAFQYAFKNFSIVAEFGGCENSLAIAKYLNNLERLGLIDISKGQSLVNKKLYDPLKTHPFIKTLITPEKYKIHNNDGYAFEEAYFSLSEFGKSFAKICISDDRRSS